MNCKPGDLAVIVSGIREEFIGRIVTCVSICHELDHTGFTHWNTEPELFIPRYALSIAIGDISLRPIRPGDISDEEVRDLYAPALPERATVRRPVHGGYPEVAHG